MKRKEYQKQSFLRTLGKLTSSSATYAPAPLNSVLHSAASTSEVLAQMEEYSDELDKLLNEEE